MLIWSLTCLSKSYCLYFQDLPLRDLRSTLLSGLHLPGTGPSQQGPEPNLLYYHTHTVHMTVFICLPTGTYSILLLNRLQIQFLKQALGLVCEVCMQNISNTTLLQTFVCPQTSFIYS